MTEPLSNKSPADPALERERKLRSLVVPHEPLEDAIVAMFDQVMDAELEELERRFGHWIISRRSGTRRRTH